MTATLETYEQAIEFLYGRINYERVQSDAYSTTDFKLDRLRLLLKLIGNPQERIPAVHVAGTKGKGSTCCMIAAVLTRAGYRTGLYTSPHLVRYEERFTVDGVLPAPKDVVSLVNRMRPVIAEMDRLPAPMHPTYFEITTAMAWLFFEERAVEMVVLETGLGGRLDATNVCRPLVTVITNVSRDHTQLLGSTVREIAGEKAGIIKHGAPVISGATHPDAFAVIEGVAQAQSAPLWMLGRELHIVDVQRSDGCLLVKVKVPGTQSGEDVLPPLPLTLRGRHQTDNLLLAAATIVRLREQGLTITDQALVEGLKTVRWPARVEEVHQQPSVVLDAAHNWAAAQALVETLRREFSPRRRILVFATTRDKDYRGLIRVLLPAFDTVILTRYLDNPRGVPIEELAAYVTAIAAWHVHTAPGPYAAWKLARKLAGDEDQIVLTGSFFLIAELRDVIVDEVREIKSVELAPTTEEMLERYCG